MAAFGRRKAEDDNSPKKKINKDSLKKSMRLFKYVKPYSGTFAVGLVFLFLSSGMSMIFPYLTGQLVDAAEGELIERINEIALWLMVIFALNAIFSYFRIYLFAVVTPIIITVFYKTGFVLCQVSNSLVGWIKKS